MRHIAIYPGLILEMAAMTAIVLALSRLANKYPEADSLTAVLIFSGVGLLITVGAVMLGFDVSFAGF